MRLAATDLDAQLVGAGGLINQQIDPRGVQGQAAPGAQTAGIEELRPDQPDLLADGEDDLQRSMRNALLTHHFQGFDDFSNPSFVVGAENGVAGAGENAVAQDRPNAGGRLDGIHVRRKQQRLPAPAGVGKAGDQVAAVAAGRGGRLIDLHLGAQLPEASGQIAGDFPLLPGGAGHGGQAGEFRGDSFAIDHVGALPGNFRRHPLRLF